MAVITYRLVMVVEYKRGGTPSNALASQITAKAILAFRWDILCCNGLTMAIYLATERDRKLLQNFFLPSNIIGFL